MSLKPAMAFFRTWSTRSDKFGTPCINYVIGLPKRTMPTTPRLKKLEKELKDIEQSQNELLEAVEQGAYIWMT
jgi:hypothetical protein